MKAQNLYSRLTPYVAMGVLALTLSSVNANAIGHKKDGHNSQAGIESVEKGDHKQAKAKKSLRRLAKKLDLSAEQRSQIKTIFAQRKAGHKERKESMAGFKAKVDTMLQNNEFDESNFAVIYSEYQAEFEQMAMEKAKARYEILQVLTPEQQQKFLKMRKHR